MTATVPDSPPGSSGGGTTSLAELVSALGAAVVDLLESPAGQTMPISSVAMLDQGDAAADIGSPLQAADLYLHVGVPEEQMVAWLEDIAHRDQVHRPVAVMTKAVSPQSAGARSCARRAGVALVAVHPRARWDHIYSLVQRVLDRARTLPAVDADLMTPDTDLFELAQVVAQNARGLVSIEDAHSHLLAYSATDESADELRMLSILGREGPREYLRVLQQWGVFDRLRRTDDVVDVPAHAELGTKRRLVVSIRGASGPARSPGTLLGSIWVQQGEQPFAADAADVLRGAAAIAARLISRSLNAPSTENMLIQRLFGARGGGVDVPSLASALNLPANGPAAVIGLAAQPDAASAQSLDFAAVATILRLHASSYRADSVTTIIGDRVYVLLPQHRSAGAVARWVQQLVQQLQTIHAMTLRAAIAAPVTDLNQVASARVEVDRVLDGTAATFPAGQVTTLAESLTTVLLGEILDLLGQHPSLHDPRVEALISYDGEHTAQLRDTVQVYLDRNGDVRATAAALQVHPNTVRYRIRRAEEVLGIDLNNAPDRLLLHLQLARRQRTET